MKLTPTKLRNDLYRLLDRVLETGETLEVASARGVIEIRPKVSPRAARKRSKPRHNPRLVVGNPDDLVHFDWSAHWKPFV